MTIGPREAAYHALLQSQQGKQFIALSLEQWKNREHPSKANFALAYEIASGATRRALTLDYIARQLSAKGQIKLRLKEKALLRIGLYQAIFMDRIPIYAAVDETVNIAKNHCHQTFVGFLNALLRKVYNGVPVLPCKDIPDELSIYYSYPTNFIARLIWDYGVEETRQILRLGNKPPVVMARNRPGFEMLILDNLSAMRQASHNAQYYIQNATPAHLMLMLAKEIPEAPKRFLDMCAAPGGKLLAAHDLFPKASIYANDPSEQRLTILRQNIEKYRIPAVLSTMNAETFPTNQQFDLVILDAPCSNSGVLNKRPEARWRLLDDQLRQLERQQAALLERAISVTKPGGEVWYMTCSILKSENQDIVALATQDGRASLRKEELVFPNQQGWDGGYAAALRRT